MKKVLLVHQDYIQHYRISIYNYLYKYLFTNNISLTVISNGTQGSTHDIQFSYIQAKLNIFNIKNIIKSENPDAIIYFVNIKNLYLFPLIIYTKFKGIKYIYWGHGIDLEHKNALLKNLIYNIQHVVSDAIILYSSNMKNYVKLEHHYKIFIANNTLNTTTYSNPSPNIKETILKKYNITTKRNIICVGRMQKRKRIDDLLKAFQLLNMNDTGLILIGPDTEGIINTVESPAVYKLGEIYGEEILNLLSIADVYCLPGHVGLGIVDAFYFGLPLVTENVDHAPEIMYLRDGENGFLVEKGDIEGLAQKLRLLLKDDSLREKFSNAAKQEISTNGHIDSLCKGFLDAINYSTITLPGSPAL